MKKKKSIINLADEAVMNKIYLVRNQKVMMDRDLAELYGVETKQLKQAVRRNILRFPKDFMFELTESEFENLRSQFVTSSFHGGAYGFYRTGRYYAFLHPEQ